MTDPFMRVDVSQGSRDFQPMALEPGLPLLDRSNSNGQTLRKWLGALVAEPERVGDRVGFYVRDDESRRIDSVFCVPVSDKDLGGELAKDFKELSRRIEAVKPQSPNEQLIHRVVSEQIRGLSDENNARDRRCCLFKFRDGKNKLHLVWAPGFRRRDNEPAAPLVCTSPACSHLFLQRRETGAKCPVCQAIRTDTKHDRPKRSFAGTLMKLLAFLFFVALGVGGTIWWQQQQQQQAKNGNGASGGSQANAPLTVEPATWSGPVGSQIQFVVTRNDGSQPEVVTMSAAVTVANPKVLSVKPYENLGKALNPGKTELTFFVGPLTAQVSITVEPRSMPSKLVLQPDKLELGVGTTAQLKLVGEYEGGKQVDLTDDAEWEARHDAKFFVHKGRVEGEEAGTGTLRVRYRANETSEPMEATAEVVIRDYEYKSLKLTLDPASPVVGKPARIHAVATTESGTELTVDESKDLTIEATPAERAVARGSELTSMSGGDVKLTAQFRGLTATLDAKIGKSTDVPHSLDVSPKSLELKIGELAQLSILSAQPKSVQLKSAHPEIAEVTTDGHVIGRGVGTAEIEISDGSEPVKITATVAAAEWKSIALEPSRLSVRSDETAPFRVFGIVDDANRVELAGDQLTWAALPRPEFAEFDKAALTIKGIKPTGDRPERITAKLNSLEASAEVEVVAPPLVLTLSPQDSIEIPVGQKRALHVKAQSGGGSAVEVSADRVEWVTSSDAGFTIKNGEIHAKTENAQIRLSARYQGATSNEVRVSSVAATPLTLKATADPSELTVGEVGSVKVSASGPGGAANASEDGYSFESSAPNVVQVVESTGAFRAMSPGTATIRVKHNSAKDPAEVSIKVTEPKVEVVAKPASLRLTSGQGPSVKLPIGAEFSDWKVEAIADDGKVTDVTDQATLVIEGDSTKSTLSSLLERVAKEMQLDVEGDPKSAAAVIRDGTIVGINPGKAKVQAVYGRIRTKQGLDVEVTSALEIDEIRVSPLKVNLIVGESASLQAEGFKAGKSVGDITSRGELVWKAASDLPIQLDGPQLTAKNGGTTTVTASLGPVASKPAEVNVLEPTPSGDTPPEVGRLVVVPSRLKIKTGEIARLGDEILVKRQDADFSDECEVAVPTTRVIGYDEDTRSLHATAPGKSRVTFIVGDQSAIMEVEVEPDVVPAADSSVIIEPSTGRIVVGEKLPLRVFIVTADGTRSPVTAALSSSDSKIGAINEGAIQGIAPGNVAVEARVPGIDKPGRAEFAVERSDFERLSFCPAALTVGVGQWKSFKVYGVTPRGRVLLGDDPDLKLSVSDDDKSTIELSAPSREVLGLRPGKAKIVATWKGGLEHSLPVNVKVDAITDLVIQPDDATVEEGESLDYQVFARRKGRLQPLQKVDGVELSVANPVIAEGHDTELRVKGVKAGKTQVTAKFGKRRAVAQLTVQPRSEPAAPPASPERLRFVSDFRQMDLGYPGDAVRVVRVLSDGTEEDVDHLVTLTVRDPKDVIQIDQTASGPIVRPKKVGQTQIDASLGDLKTQKPFLIEVAPRIPRQHELRARPSSLRLQVGEIGRFTRAEILPASGGSPIPVPFTVTATPNKFVEIKADNSIRGLAVGTAVVTLTANDAEGKYNGIATSATIEVIDPDQDSSTGTAPGSSPPPELTLNGPSETNVGAEVQMQAEIVQGGKSTDVTDRAQLVLVAGDEQLAEVRPGGVILAKAPGRITVQAKLNDLTSSPQEIVIRPLAEFERLELDVARKRIGEGEARGYKLWGYPRGGGARQDLTRLVTDDAASKNLPHMELKMLKPNPGTQVVAHRPGSFVGRQAGLFSAQALLGDKLASETVTLEVVGGVPAPERMKVEPDRLELRAGDQSPPIRVLVASAGDHNFREVDSSLVTFTSSDSEILQPSDPGLFTAAKPGQAKIKVSFQGLEESVPVTVKYNPFFKIEVGRDPKFVDSTLTVDLAVTANTSNLDLEYRTTLPNSGGRADEETSWVKADKDGNQLLANLRTPKIPLVRGQNHYSVVIEAKNLKSGEIERHPFSFRIVSTSGGSKSGESK